MDNARECATMLLQTIHPLMRTIRDASRQMILPVGTTPTMEQFRLLQILSAHQLSLRQLAASHGVRSSTMSRSIEVVVQNGWVTRTPDPADRRQVVLAITPQGHMVHDEMVREVHDHMTERLARLGPEDCMRLRGALEVMRDVLIASTDGIEDEDCPVAQSTGERSMEPKV